MALKGRGIVVDFVVLRAGLNDLKDLFQPK